MAFGRRILRFLAPNRLYCPRHRCGVRPSLTIELLRETYVDAVHHTFLAHPRTAVEFAETGVFSVVQGIIPARRDVHSSPLWAAVAIWWPWPTIFATTFINYPIVSFQRTLIRVASFLILPADAVPTGEMSSSAGRLYV